MFRPAGKLVHPAEQIPRPTTTTLAAMIGVILIVLALLVVIPVGFLMSTSVAAAVLGFLLKDDADRRHADSELLDTNY